MTVAGVNSEGMLERITGCFAGFFGTWVMSIGRRARLFETLHVRGPLAAAELARELGYEPRYVETWCRGAFAFGLLDHDPRSGFRLGPHVAELMLDPAGPSFMGGRAEFFPMLTDDFDMYPERMADGGLYRFADRPPELVRAMQAAARADAPNMIANVIPTEPELEASLRAGGRVLDVGCGAGYGLLAFADAYPASEIVGIEIDETSLESARSLAGERARVERMHVGELTWRDEFDLAYANISLSHTWGAGPEVFRAVRAALKPGGWFLASDVPNPESLEDLRSPAGQLFVGVTVYVSLLGFELLSPSRLVGLLEEAGFEAVHRVEQPARTRMMVLGRKP